MSVRDSRTAEPRPNFDPIWEEAIYGRGYHLNKYPFDLVVSFVFRHAPRTKPRDQVHVLEVGCGAGNNLWFVAREGFSAAGLDASPSAIAHARDRFQAEGLSADLRVGDFTALPFPENSFDLVIDRGALTCCGLTACRRALDEVHRVLAPGGAFLFNPYSDLHSSKLAGRPAPDGLTLDIQGGSLVGVGQLAFHGEESIRSLIGDQWQVVSRQLLTITEHAGPGSESGVHAEWRIILRKPDANP